MKSCFMKNITLLFKNWPLFSIWAFCTVSTEVIRNVLNACFKPKWYNLTYNTWDSDIFGICGRRDAACGVVGGVAGRDAEADGGGRARRVLDAAHAGLATNASSVAGTHSCGLTEALD